MRQVDATAPLIYSCWNKHDGQAVVRLEYWDFRARGILAQCHGNAKMHGVAANPLQ